MKEQTVLIVEDSPGFAELLRYVAEDEGFNPVLFPLEENLLEWVDKSQPAVICMDLALNRLNGFDFIHELKKHTKHKRIPIIVITGKDLSVKEITDLKVTGPEDRKDTFFHKIWESLVGAAGVVLKNQQKDQVATKIRLEGNFNNPHTNTLDAIWGILRNAFVVALTQSIDNEIDINSVKNAKPDKRNFLQKIFSPEKKKGKKENK